MDYKWVYTNTDRLAALFLDLFRVKQIYRAKGYNNWKYSTKNNMFLRRYRLKCEKYGVKCEL